ncbi:MAG: STAS domain-containing protein [Gammaproteobacteria bacterium]|jgi:anti-anti-sigma factor
MGIEVKTEGCVCYAVVEGEMNIYSAKEQREAWLEHCRQMAAREVVLRSVDLSAVTDMDAAGLQLLVALKKHLMQANGPLRLVNPSECVREAVAQAQLGEQFPEIRREG